MTLGRHKFRADAINAALTNYVQHRNQLKVIELFGTIDYDDDYDPKTQRSRNMGSHRIRTKLPRK
jgi:hypothetical protein